jgi:hypothetical protein
MKNKLTIITSSILAFTPAISFAAFTGTLELLKGLRGMINIVIPLLFGLALIYFFWGLIQFISNAGEQKTRDEGKTKMVWGVVALFVFVSIFGILNMMSGLFGFSGGSGGGGDPCVEGMHADGSSC